MPTSPLPSDPSFENLRKRAKALLASVRDGDPAGIALVREHHPRADAALPKLKLADAQLVVARGHGFASWARLKAHLEVVERHEWAPTVARDGEPLEDTLARLACMDYAGWTPDRAARARELLVRNPDLSRANIYAAATVGDVEAVSAFLAADRDLADRKGGPLGWEPLLYACYTRLDSPNAGHSTLEVARLLLAAGADPDAGFLWRGNVPPFTALTGVFGEGENGNNEPPHRHRDALARLLLEAGADANDGQTLYNRHFNRPDDHLELLFEYGLGGPPTGPWFAELGERLDPPGKMLLEELWQAAGKGFAERVKLLVEHGVDVNLRSFRDGTTPYEHAVRMGNVEIAAYLVAHGAQRASLSRPEQLGAALVADRRDEAERMMRDDPALLAAIPDDARAHLLTRAVEARRFAAVRYMAELGFPLDGRVRGPYDGESQDPQYGVTAMHDAAWQGNLDGVRLLVELGAHTDVRDPAFFATPIGWAHHNHQHAVVAYLMSYASIFEAVACDGVERVAELLRADPSLARAVDRDGRPLAFRLYAELHRIDELLALLAPHGFDIDARDRDGRTALDRAIERHRDADVAMLRARGATTTR